MLLIVITIFLNSCANRPNEETKPQEPIHYQLIGLKENLRLRAPRDTSVADLIKIRLYDLNMTDSLLKVSGIEKPGELLRIKARNLIQYKKEMYQHYKNDSCCLDLIAEASEIAEQLDDQDLRIDIIKSKIDEVFDRGDVDSLVSIRKTLVEYYKSINDSEQVYVCYRSAFKTLEKYERYEEAIPLIQEALPYSKCFINGDGIRTPYHTNGALKVLARIYYKMGKYDKSEEIIEKIDTWFRNHHDAYIRLDYMELVGDMFIAKGQYNQAITIFYDNLEESRKIGWILGEYQSLERLARINMDLREYEESRKNLYQMIYYAERKFSDLHKGRAYAMLANLYFEMQQFDSSIVYFEKAQLINLKLVKPLSDIDTRHGIALYNTDKLNESKKLLNRALYSAPINDSLMAQIYLSKIDWDEGKTIQTKNKALKIFDHPVCAENLHIQKLVLESLSKMSRYSGNYRDAFRYQSMQMDVDSALQANYDINELLHRKYNFEYNEKVLRDSIIFLRASHQLKLDMQKKEEDLVREQEKRQFYLISLIMTLLGLAAIVVLYVQVRKTKRTSDNLLLNILPEETARELKQKGYTDAKEFDQATILFTDFKGFTSMSEQMSAADLVAEIDVCFKVFDHIMEKYKIEKIKTIGDAYMAAGGLPVPDTALPADVVRAGLEMQEFISNRKVMHDELGLPSFQMRVGIHTGPVIAGVVGVKKFQYDIWGDTVNTASRMESSGEVGQVNISHSTYQLMKDDPEFTFQNRGKIEAKGKGEMEMYFVSKRNINKTNSPE